VSGVSVIFKPAGRSATEVLSAGSDVERDGTADESLVTGDIDYRINADIRASVVSQEPPILVGDHSGHKREPGDPCRVLRRATAPGKAQLIHSTREVIETGVAPRPRSKPVGRVRSLDLGVQSRGSLAYVTRRLFRDWGRWA
jgi:hypothetical protein